MATHTYNSILKYGTQAQYNALASKDETQLYFCTDTGKLYKGDTDFSVAVVKVASKPQTPIANRVYVITGTGTTEFFDGTSWTVITPEVITAITSASTDAQLPSAKAVWDLIQGIVTGSDVVKSIALKQSGGTVVPGTLAYVTGDDVSHDVALTGGVFNPTYDAESRTITLPRVGAQDLVIALGKDIFLDPTPGANYYDPDTNEIVLTLNDGSAGHDATVIRIPVGGLIDTYTGGTTQDAVVSIDSNNEITVDLVIKPDVSTPGSEWTNGLQSTANGLVVDFTDLETDIAAVDSKADDNATDIASLYTAMGWSPIS